MIRFLTFFLLALVALLLESTWLAGWPTVSLRFELVWIFVLYLGFSTTLQEGSLLVVTLGLLEDIWTTPFLGLFTTCYLFFFTLLRLFIANMYLETLWSRLVWVGAFSLLATGAEFALLTLVGQNEGFRNFLLTYGLLQSLLNMGIAALLFPLLDRLETAFFKR